MPEIDHLDLGLQQFFNLNSIASIELHYLVEKFLALGFELVVRGRQIIDFEDSQHELRVLVVDEVVLVWLAGTGQHGGDEVKDMLCCSN
jgi:hypothetical protein